MCRVIDMSQVSSANLRHDPPVPPRRGVERWQIRYNFDRRLHPWSLVCIGCAYGFWVRVVNDLSAETYARLHASVAHGSEDWTIGPTSWDHG